jgi:hypothetical protein
MSGAHSQDEITHLIVTCLPDASILEALQQDVTLWLRQRSSPARIFVSGYEAKDEKRAFFVLECEKRLFPWPLSNWLSLEPRVLSFTYYSIPQAQEPPHAAYVLAALETWLKQQGKQIIPDRSAPGGFRVVSAGAEKGAGNGRTV